MINIFISHQDQETAIDGQSRWLDNFTSLVCENLGLFVTDTITITSSGKGKSSEADLFIAITSPAYFANDERKRELLAFRSTHGQNLTAPGADGITKHRVFWVERSRSGALPPGFEVLDKHRPLPFYDENDESNQTTVWKNSTHPKEFSLACTKLANFLRDTLEAVKGNQEQLKLPKVFVGYTTDDMVQAMTRLRNNLSDVCVFVPPQNVVLRPDESFSNETLKLMQECVLSIHPLGLKRGPSTEEETCIETELKLARELSKDETKFSRLIWMSASCDPSKAARQEHRELITNLQKSKDFNYCEEHTASGLIRAKLAEAKQPKPLSNAGQLLYLLYEKRDAEDVMTFAEKLAESHHLIVPLFEHEKENESEIRLNHVEALKQCDEVRLFWGKAAQFWILANLQDIRKSPGFGRPSPPRPTRIKFCPEDPDTEQKKLFKKFGPRWFGDLDLGFDHD